MVGILGAEMALPYENMAKTAFWRTGVAERQDPGVSGLWRPGLRIAPDSRIASYGSCFAQHISRALKARGVTAIDAEPAPNGLKPAHRPGFGYGLFSSRTGNIYTSTMLLNWCRWALAGEAMPGEIWHGEDGVIDPLRPTIEPCGFADEAELQAARATTLAGFAASVEEADLLIFTLGLTERWVNRATGMEYAACPGTQGGVFDADRHVFDNLSFSRCAEALNEAFALMQKANPRLRFLLSVSPVPLTATASDAHVLVATGHSKAVLRAVAGEMTVIREDVDYFPSYELITAPTFGGRYYGENQRSVTPEGVAFVMRHFFQPFDLKGQMTETPGDHDIRCDEELLDAFGPLP